MPFEAAPRVIVRGWGGAFEGPVKEARGSAERLVRLLARMPMYQDVALYESFRVPFLKRAQITCADLATALRGRIRSLALPEGPGIRLECGVAAGVEVSVHYDPLLAKLIATGVDRGEAITRMAAGLAAFRVEGVATVIPFHARVMASAAFRAGELHSQMVEQGAFNA